MFVQNRTNSWRPTCLARTDTDIGRWFIGRGILAHVAEGGHGDLVRREYETLRGLPLADAAMREAMALHLPAPLRLLEARDASVLVLRKRADFVALSDLQRYVGGAIPPRHVAWILSGLLNIACYLQWAGLSHMAISPAHCLVSPARHGVVLAGGWWCAAPSGAPIRALPARSVRAAPSEILDRRRADPRLDALLIRETGWELLGPAAREAPAAMREFLTLPRRGDAVADYEAWQRTLWRCFGERRFCDLGVDAEDVYAMTS